MQGLARMGQRPSWQGGPGCWPNWPTLRLVWHSWSQGRDDTRTPCQRIALRKGYQPTEILLQTREFCPQQLLFPSTMAVFHRGAWLRGCAVYKRSDSAPCCRKHSRVNYSFNTFFLVAVAQFTVKLGENAENKGAIV